MTAPFDFTPLLPPNTPAPAVKWNGFPKYNFIGGHNDAKHVPVDALIAAATAVLKREGATLATYGLNSGPLGYRPLREFLAGKLKGHAGIDCSPDEILVTSGSMQGLDLVNSLLLTKDDTILIEQETYGGALMKIAREHGVMIFEDECYSDLIWDGKRPRSLFAMAGGEGVIHIGSFSKSIAPALRVGYLVAKWEVLSRILALKQDAGSGALEQMILAEFCKQHFADHVPRLSKTLAGKLQTLREALAEQFGTAAEFGDPPGGIYLWIKLPDNVDTVKLGQAALAAGVSINPGPEWSTNKEYSKCRLRLCFANPEPETIKQGVAVLAEICRREFGVPLRSANIDKG
jgi:DNA-binding transcriptional MocR family regulator